MINKADYEKQQTQILKEIKGRMKVLKVSQKHISEVLCVTERTISNYFKGVTPMPFIVYLMILGILDTKKD